MFVPNDNGYPTMIYNKNFGVPGYKIVKTKEEHESELARLNILDNDEPINKILDSFEQETVPRRKKQKYTIEG